MPTESKIPPQARQIGAISIGGYSIFCPSPMVYEVHRRLAEADKKPGMPAVGYINLKGEKIYYCRNAFINDPGIYKK